MTPVASTFQSTTVQQHPTTVQHWSSNSPLATTVYATGTSCLSQHINLSRGFPDLVILPAHGVTEPGSKLDSQWVTMGKLFKPAIDLSFGKKNN